MSRIQRSFLSEDLVDELQPVEFCSSGSIKILGLCWLPEEDIFTISVKLVNLKDKLLTKRLVAKVYDPLGFAQRLQ